MKAFRGTLLAAGAVGLLGGAWWWAKPAETPQGAGEEQATEKLFPFEKADLVKVSVERPDATITLEERADGWWIVGEERRASQSMVSRVRHQLHDLSARATVVPEGSDGSLYGLGASAVRVTLTMRDGATVRFSAGDPNPTGVSFYLQKEGDPRVYTVKKSAVDYYSLSLEEFRERRFAAFDSKDVDAVEAELPGGARLAFQRAGQGAWDLTAPERFAAEPQEVAGLMGRVSALKAVRFVDSPPGPEVTGLESPRARVTLRFAGKAPLVLKLGNRLGEKDGDYELAYAVLEGEPAVYAVRDDLIADWANPDLERFRLRRFVRAQESEVTRITCTLSEKAVPEERDLAGVTEARSEGESWFWADGKPVAGATPRRVVGQAANLEAASWVGASPEEARFGFGAPRVTLVLTPREGEARTVVLGARTKPRVLPLPPDAPPQTPKREIPQAFARTLDRPDVYVVDESLLEGCRDLRREATRKEGQVAEQTARQQRIEAEQSSRGAGKGAAEDAKP
jgi:hypothetical protein